MQLEDVIMQVSQTGQLPPEEEINALINTGDSAQSRATTRRALRRALIRIADAVRDGHAQHAQTLADGALIEYAQHNREAATTNQTDPRKLADLIDRNPIGRTDSTPRVDLRAVEPLRQLLRHAAGGGTVTAGGIAELTVNAGVTDEQRDQWRAKVGRTVDRLQKTHASGEQGLARQLADEALGELAPSMGIPEPADDTPSDPRGLADLIHRSQRIG